MSLWIPNFGREVINIKEISTVTDESVQVVRFIFGTSTTESLHDILTNFRTLYASIEITTAYSDGTIIQVGHQVDANLLMDSNLDNLDLKNLNTYDKEQDTPWGPMDNKVRVTISGGPAVGAGICTVKYSNPLD